MNPILYEVIGNKGKLSCPSQPAILVFDVSMRSQNQNQELYLPKKNALQPTKTPLIGDGSTSTTHNP
jgi:hypothetical protein